MRSGLLVFVLIVAGQSQAAEITPGAKPQGPLPPEPAGQQWLPTRVFGQTDFTQTSYNEVTPDRFFHPAGFLIDPMKGDVPSRLYVWDSGNNRVLGFDHVGHCAAGPKKGAPCTENSLCTQSSCTAETNAPATIIIGQPSGTTSSCNGDNTMLAPASKRSLCTTPYPYLLSPLEGPTGNTMAVDKEHSLYVVDMNNNRLLKFLDPFQTDTAADAVYGQNDFTSRLCNRGLGAPTASALCTGDPGHFYPNYYFAGGADVSADGSTLWVADLGNQRVLRFTNGSTKADLVLGQADMTSNDMEGCFDAARLDKLCRPNAVRWDQATGRLFVVNGDNDAAGGARIFIYHNPNVDGQPASEVIGPPVGSSFLWPRGITFDPVTAGAFWLSDADNARILQYVPTPNLSYAPVRVLGQPDLISVGCVGHNWSGPLIGNVCRTNGAVGVDRDGSVYAGDTYWEHAARFPAPIPTPTELGGLAYSPDAYINEPSCYGWANHVGPSGLANPADVLFVGTRMYVTDRQRIVFWDLNARRASGVSAGPASGVLGQPAMNTQCNQDISHGADFFRLSYDSARDILYATHGSFITAWMPGSSVVSTSAPSFEIASPLPTTDPLRMLTFVAAGIVVSPETDSAWVSDLAYNQVFRIIDLSKPTRRVDAVLGQSSILDPSQSGPTCNRRGGETPVRDGFCAPTQVKRDRFGNLYVVDGIWEMNGNRRVLEFEAAGLPPIPSPALVWATGRGPQPKRVYAKPSFTTRECDPDDQKPCTPIGVSFDPRTNQMVMVVDGYGNSLKSRVFVYDDPLEPTATPLPSSTMGVAFNQPSSSDWDSSNDLVVLDHTWNRATLFACKKAALSKDQLCAVPDYYDPVCGCDGRTYANPWAANCAVTRWTRGACSDKVPN